MTADNRSNERSEERTIVVAMTGEDGGDGDRETPGPDTLLAGRYRLGRLIGKGGMGEVVSARDEQVGRDVAVKRMRAANPSERAIRRFLREASIQGRLEHPAFVPVHEIGREGDGLPFFVMKKVAGTSLAKILGADDRAGFPLQRVLRAFGDACLAVELAHVRGIVHRDLKPDNLMLGDFGEVYVLDWGVAKVVGEEDGEFADVDSTSGERTATKAGAAIGTPGYMSPEQVRGNATIDGRADVYTLGCILFEILTGEPLHPRGARGLQSALEPIDARPSARRPDLEIPPELDALVVAATALRREERLATARELGVRTHEYLDGDRDLARRRALAEEHLGRARVTFDGSPDDAGRRQAMRDAAAALALDPSLGGAAELVGRLMLEPPSDTPPEVAEAIRADDLAHARTIAKAGLGAVIASFVFLPLLWWIAPPGSRYLPVLLGMLVLNGAVALHAIRAATPRLGLIVLTNTVIVVLLSRMYSPILIAPGVAASLAMAMVLMPRFSRLISPGSIAVAMGSAVLVPWGLERLGVLSTTVAVDGAAILLRAPAISGHEGPTLLVGAIYTMGLIVVTSTIAEVMRNRTRAAQRHLYLQAWQLRHLVPG